MASGRQQNLALGFGVCLWPILEYRLRQDDQRVQPRLELAARFSEEHMVRASFALIDITTTPPTQHTLNEAMQTVSPLSQQLNVIATCIQTEICDRNLSMADIFDRAQTSISILRAAFQHSNQEYPNRRRHFEETLDKGPSPPT